MTILHDPDGDVTISRAGARADVVVRVRSGKYSPTTTFSTAYPDDLLAAVLELKGAAYLGDEVLRDESPAYVQKSLESGILPFVAAEEFAGRRILDFGCGAGASTCILARMFPESEIVGVELDAGALRVARARLAHYGFGQRVRLIQSPGPLEIPAGLGVFDYVSFSAVYEHLLPAERAPILRQVWATLKPDGVLFINQLPNRLSLIEHHTTSGMPFINYLPDRATNYIASNYSKRVRGRSWESLLRAGIRGGTEAEIVAHLNDIPGAGAVSLKPLYGPRNDIELWFQSTSTLSARSIALKNGLRLAAYSLWPLRRFILPGLILAIRKT